MKVFHLDLKRSMYRLDFLEGFLSQLAEWGYTHILLELQDKFPFKKHPEIACEDAFDDTGLFAFRRLCDDLNLEIMPECQAMGHVSYILAKPEFAKYREAENLRNHYHPLSLESRQFVIDQIDEILDAFPESKYFHLGGDECWQLGSSDGCRESLEKLGPGGMYLEHMNPIMEHVISRGVRPVIWADIVLGHPDLLPKFNDQVVFADWNYHTTARRTKSIVIWGAVEGLKPAYNVDMGIYSEWATPCFKEHFEPYALDDQSKEDEKFNYFFYSEYLKERGHDLLLCPATRCVGDLVGMPKFDNYRNCYFAGRKAKELEVDLLVTSWMVRHNQLEVNMPAIYASVQGLRDESDREMKELLNEYAKVYFELEDPRFAEAVEISHHECKVFEGAQMAAAEKKIDRGEDPLEFFKQKLVENHGDTQAALAYLKSQSANFESALQLMREWREGASKNAEKFDLWIEGLTHNLFVFNFFTVILEDRVALEKEALRQRVSEMRTHSESLFAKCFTPISVQVECDTRYAFFEKYLDQS